MLVISIKNIYVRNKIMFHKNNLLVLTFDSNELNYLFVFKIQLLSSLLLMLLNNVSNSSFT